MRSELCSIWSCFRLDDRNQLELFAAMPGGYDALRELHEAFYAEGVRVIWVGR